MQICSDFRIDGLVNFVCVNVSFVDDDTELGTKSMTYDIDIKPVFEPFHFTEFVRANIVFVTPGMWNNVKVFLHEREANVITLLIKVRNYIAARNIMAIHYDNYGLGSCHGQAGCTG